MSCATGVVKRTYAVLKNALVTGFGVAVPLPELGRKGRITNVKLRLDNTRDGAQAVELFIADDALTSAPDGLDTIIHEEVVGLVGSATVLSADIDYDRYYSVANAGDLTLNLNFLAVDGVEQSTVYVEITAEVCG